MFGSTFVPGGGGGGGGTKKYCRIYRSTSQTFASGTDAALSLDTALIDSGFWSASNPTRLTIPSAMIAVAVGNIVWNPNATGWRHTYIRCNGPTGSIIAFEQLQAVSVAVAGTIMLVTSMPWSFAAGDYIELFCGQNSGGNLSIGASSPTSNYPSVFGMFQI